MKFIVNGSDEQFSKLNWKQFRKQFQKNYRVYVLADHQFKIRDDLGQEFIYTLTG